MDVRPKRSLRRRIVIVLIALVLLILAVRTGVDLWAGYRVGTEAAKLEAAHGSLDPSTLQLPAVPEAENRARAMRAATALVTGDSEAQPSLTRFLAQRGVVAVPPDLQAFVEANHAAIRVAADARGRRLSNWEADYTTGHNTPGLLEIRALSNVIYLAGRMELDAGRADAAADQFATGLALSASLRQEPTLITQLIRCAVALQQFEGVQRLMTQAEPSEAALGTLANALDENRLPSPMHVGFLGEVKTFHAAMSRAGNGNVDDILRATNQSGGTPMWAGPLSRFSRPLIRLWHANYLKQLGRLLDIEAGPRPRPAPAGEEPSWPIMKVGIAGLERAMDTGDHFSSTLGLTELAVALRRFRLAHGEYPDALGALVPAYAARVPTDPFTGNPPVYARQAQGFTLTGGNSTTGSRLGAALREWNVSK